jgi:hypothetical protein
VILNLQKQWPGIPPVKPFRHWEQGIVTSPTSEDKVASLMRGWTVSKIRAGMRVSAIEANKIIKRLVETK